MVYKDGTTATYDRALHSLTLDIPHSGSSLSITVNGNAIVHASGNALVEAEGNATLSAGAVGRIEAGTRIDIVAPAVSITSTVTVSGDVTAGGKSLINHVHGGVTRGGASTNPPA
jgi:phage baseplate assembly protein V